MTPYKDNRTCNRLLFLLRLYVTLLLIFMTQKLIFMLCNLGFADHLTVGDWLAVMWHGLPLDSVTACYLLWPPTLLVWVSLFVHDISFKRWLTPYFALISLPMSIVFVADVVMYRFWGAKIDANDLMYVTHPKDMLASVAWWMVLLGALVVLLIAVHYTLRLRHTAPQCMSGRPHWWWIPLFILLGGLQFVGMRGSVSESVANASYAYFSPKPFLNHAALNPMFNMMYSLSEQEDFESEFHFYDDNELSGLIDGAFYTDNNIDDTLLRTTRPDILVIVWEGAGCLMVNNDSVAPNLHALRSEGVWFDQCFANSYRTDRGLVSLFSGWPGLPTASLMKRPDICRRLPGLASELRKAGYSTLFRYGGDADFTNMRGYLYEAGFDRVDGNEAFPGSRRKSSWGAPDEYLLNMNYDGVPTPGFTVLLTLSSHEPWQVPVHRFSDDRKNSFAYTDSCVGAFIHKLKQSSQWDNLLVIIVPDHGIPVQDGQATSDPQVARIPMLWLGGAVRQPAVVSRMMNQSDLAATLLAQLGLPVDKMTMSRNVLSPSYSTTPPFAIHAFRNGINYFDTTEVTSYDCVSDQATGETTSPSEQQMQRLRAQLQFLYQRTGKL